MDVDKLHNSIPGGLNISLKDANIWVNEELNLLGSEHSLKLLNFVSLLVFFVLLVSLVQLSEVELEVKVVRVNESSFGVVSGVKFFSVKLSAAGSASVDDPSGDVSPHLDKRVLKKEHKNDEDKRSDPDDHVLLSNSLRVKVESVVTDKAD